MGNNRLHTKNIASQKRDQRHLSRALTGYTSVRCVKGNKSWHVNSSSVEMVRKLLPILGIGFDHIEPSPVSSSNSIIKVWAIGELADYLNGV